MKVLPKIGSALPTAQPEALQQVRRDVLGRAEHASKRLLYDADPMDAHPALGGNAGAPIMVALGDRPFRPKPNKIYQTEVPWGGAKHAVQLSVDPDVAEFLKVRGHQIDLSKLEIVRVDRSRDPILEKGWETTLDRVLPMPEAPPHLIEEPILAKQLHVYSRGRNEDGDLMVALSIGDYAIDLDVFTCKDREKNRPIQDREVKAMLEPLPITEDELARKRLADGIEVSGLSAEAIASVQPSIDAVLGRSLAKWPELRRSMEAEVEALRAREKEIEKAWHPSKADEYSAVLSRKSELLFKLSPIEIVVVPKGKHLTAMPQGERHRANANINSMGVNCFTGYIDEATNEPRIKRMIFIPEDDPMTQRHELYHLLEMVMMTPEQIAVLDREYSAAVANRGPFARPYGIQRAEMISTWGELFEGAGGEAGLRYLEEKAPAISGLIRDVTGR